MKIEKVKKQKIKKEKKQKPPRGLQKLDTGFDGNGKVKKQKPPKQKKEKSKGSAVKNVFIVLLAVIVAVESGVLLLGKGKESKAETPAAEAQAPQIVLNLNAGALMDTVASEVTGTVTDAVASLAEKMLPKINIMGTVKGIVYSDTIVNLLMSMSYPLLFQVLTDLELMDFAENVELYPTPKQLAAHIKSDAYSCCDKNANRRPLKDVLKEANGDWGYFDTEVTTTDKYGQPVTNTLWNTIVWGVGGKDSFYSVMADMTVGLTGVLQITLQGIKKDVNINLVEFLLKKDFANINLDAAQIFNGTGKSGYETCLIPLFSMLGLTPSDYPSIQTFCAYKNIGDIWAAIFESVLTAVSKALADPLNVLPNMLVNFVNAVETGSLVKGLKTLRMDATYHKLAGTFMGYEDGLIFNLGEALVGIIEEMGIKITGNFNGVLDSLLQLILKNPSADLPDMDVNAIMACASKGADTYGNAYYYADLDQMVDFFVNYIVQERILNLVFDLTDFLTPEEEALITASVSESREGLINLVNTVVEIVMPKVKTALAEHPLG